MSGASLDLARLAERGSLPEERLTHGHAYTPAAPGDDADRVESRMTRWRHLVARGDEESFKRCLASEGLDLEIASRSVSAVRWIGGASWPDWVAVVSRAAGLAGETKAPSAMEPAAALAVPFVRVLRERLAETAPTLAMGLRESLEAGLARAIGYVATRVLALEREIHELHCAARGVNKKEAVVLLAQQLEGREGFVGLISEYAVLARHMAVLTLRVATVTAELLERLARDLPEIGRHFDAGRDPGALVALTAGLSDPHRGGRTVMVLRFESGLEIVYKPRSIAMDVAYDGLLDWMQTQASPVPLRRMRSLDRGEYAWIEFLRHSPCRDANELTAFARSAGALLAVAYLLDATDLHDGNVFACGQDIVAIDLETLLSPHFLSSSQVSGETAESHAAESLRRSVLRTVLLPIWRALAGKSPADIGGLGALCGGGAADWYPRNDESDPTGGKGIDAALAGSDQTKTGLAEAVQAGFAATYDFLSARKAALTDPAGPLTRFRGVPVRVLFRDTQFYMKVIDRALVPDALRDGADFWIELESFKRLLHVAWTQASFVPVLRSEQRSMAALDVPYFATSTDSAALFDDAGAAIPGFFARSSHEEVSARARGLDDLDRDRQLGLVRTAFAARLARPLHEAAPVRALTLPGPIETEQALSVAMAIAERLDREAIRGADGSVIWVGPVPLAGTDRLNVGLTQSDLQSGSAGVLVFLSALQRVAPHAGIADLWGRTLLPLDRAFRNASATDVGSLGPGANTGLGSIVWSLAVASELTARPEAWALCQHVASLLAALPIEREHRPRVFDGLAGGVLALLHLARRGSGVAAEQASRLGHRLLALRASGVGPSWAAIPREGFSHGLPGIACAFARLGAVTGEAVFSEAAAEAFDLCASAAPVHSGFCHGVAGSAIALLACRDTMPEPVWRPRLDTALATLAETPLDDLDSLCCGALGRADVLLECGEILRDLALVERARRIGAMAVARGVDQGFTMFGGLTQGPVQPGLLLGDAGVGYALLRLTAPGTLPPPFPLG